MITQGSGSRDVDSFMGKSQQLTEDSVNPSNQGELLQDINTSLVFRNCTTQNGLPTQVDVGGGDSRERCLLGIVVCDSPEMNKGNSSFITEESLDFDNRDYNKETNTTTQEDTQIIENISSQNEDFNSQKRSNSKSDNDFDQKNYKIYNGLNSQAVNEASTQKIEGSTQVVSNDNRLQNGEEDCYCYNNSDQTTLHQVYFDSEEQANYVCDTQRLNPPYNNGFIAISEESNKVPYTSPLNNDIQIPCTAEKPRASRRQVISTQEMNDDSPSGRKIEMSQGNVLTEKSDPEEEICSDDEYDYQKNPEVLSKFLDVKKGDGRPIVPPRRSQSDFSANRESRSLRICEIEKVSPNLQRIVTDERENNLSNKDRLRLDMIELLADVAGQSPQGENALEENGLHDTKSDPRYPSSKAKHFNAAYLSSSPIKNIACDRSTSVPDLRHKLPFTSTPIYSNSVMEHHISKTQFHEPSILREETQKSLGQMQIKSKKNVWTLIEFNMYPGYISRLDPHELFVTFEEGNFPVKTSDLYPLDLRINDLLKIQSSKFKYIVTGLLYRESGGMVTCIRGFNQVILRRYTKAKHRKFDEFEISISNCYMELSDWFRKQSQLEISFKTHDLLEGNTLRSFKKYDGGKEVLTQNEKLAAIGDKEIYGTLNPICSILENSTVKGENNKEGIGNCGKSHLFDGMLFFVTFSKNIDEVRRKDLSTLIYENGGILIDDLLTEVIDNGHDEEGNLMLVAPSLGRFVFGAVLSNEHCRSAKYLQALALGWPILSENYIFDCIEDNNRIEEWPTYMLPAGKSKVLNTLRSLDVFIFRKNYESQQRLSLQLTNNKGLLNGVNIFILNSSNKSKTVRTCQFIFHAFGAKSLTHLDYYEDVFESLVRCERYFLYDDSGCLDKTERQLSAKQNMVSRSRKKKRIGDSVNPLNYPEIKIGLIDWEWVVQCTISNFIWKPKYVLLI